MLALSSRDGSMSARSASNSRKKGTASLARGNNEFLRFVERTEDAFTMQDDSAVEDVRRILNDVRSQYDHVHKEAEKKESELQRLKEVIRVHESSHSYRADESGKVDDLRSQLRQQIEETDDQIKEAMTSQKVYRHMLARVTKEQAILKQKLVVMDQHLERKSAEAHRKLLQQERLIRKGALSAQELDSMEQEAEMERAARENAQKSMQIAIEAKIAAKERRERFEEWRHEVALDAANEAFNAAAGRLRKLYAVEKLAGNCLQKITFEQVERSQATENGFQNIRDVTGLTDVMDIVHKFLNRDVEHEQLKSSVKEAEQRLETLREQYERLKKDTDGLTFDADAAARNRQIYMEVEEHEAQLQQVLKTHEQARQRLQQSTLQVEHMKRWANRVGRSLSMFEECTRVDKAADLPVFFQQMQRAVDKFIAHIVQQISSGKVQRKNMSQVASKEYHEASRLLADKDFLRSNCRVPASLDAGRPPSRQGAGGVDEESADALQQEREKWKTESNLKVQVEEAKKRNPRATQATIKNS
mmetsp:Transcript_49463/g.117701  ORF Transcript_49463/g.117701 Transcript_49463/m.117701 type:complete len:531 (-) Transcript_49463:200-1792(-)